ncbi:MAG: hypothetical protein MK033_05170 [Candidatus Caenarcaniphilales bacterium]|nr:hypothetical protein [Candidatus Caenarcaniphilales bacterium]
MTVTVRNKIKTLIEAKFISPEKVLNLCSMVDGEQRRIYFGTTAAKTKVVLMHEGDQINVIIEYCKDSSKVYHIQSDSSNLPAMHKLLPNGGEIIYLFDAKFNLTKMVQISPKGYRRICKFQN